jgi:outer membrane protein OmpA-like peptidoglycan-associated protein
VVLLVMGCSGPQRVVSGEPPGRGSDRHAFRSAPHYPDRDRDRTPDIADLCPDAPEDTDGFQDQDGCPDVDNDQDRIVDANDKCPNEPETYNGLEDGDGCPDRGWPIGRLEIHDQFYFDEGRADLRPVSSPLLDLLAPTIRQHGSERLAVDGHVAEGERKGLAAARARAVVDALVARGVEARQLVARDQGKSKPVCLERTKECRASNRRVDFEVLRLLE